MPKTKAQLKLLLPYAKACEVAHSCIHRAKIKIKAKPLLLVRIKAHLQGILRRYAIKQSRIKKENSGLLFITWCLVPKLMPCKLYL